MALIVLFIISTAFFFINIEPLRATGVFFIICYLPGLCFFFLGKKEKIIFDDFLLAFPCSVGISSILTLGLLSVHIPVQYVPIMIYMISGAAVLFFLLKNKDKPKAVIVLERQEMMFCFVALLAVLLLSIPFFFGPNRIAIAGHAFHHSLMVTQILNGIFPPENPGLGGTIIGYYWGFHGFIAALTARTAFQQLQIIFILNMISLFFVFCISYSIARAFGLSLIFRYILPLAVIGLMRADAGILVLAKLITGKLISFKEITNSPIEPRDILMNWIGGLPLVDTRLFVLRKYYHISGMPIAVTLCFSYLLVLLHMVKRRFDMDKTYIIIIAFIISACFFNYPPLAIFLLLHAPLWAVYIFLSGRGCFRDRIRESFRILLPYVVAGASVTPYMLFVMASRDISSSGQGGIFSFDFYDQSLKNMVVFLVPLPVIIYGIWITLKRLRVSGESFFLIIGTILCLALILFTRWPFDNSYKYNYILLFFFALFFVFALSRLIPLIASRWLRRSVLAVIILVLSSTALIVEASHIVSSFSTDYLYSLFGGHITYAQDKQKNEAYKWIRENTPGDALIMLSYTETNWPCCAFNNNYQHAAIAERNLYVIKDADYTVSNPEYEKRIEFRERLFENPNDSQVIDFFTSLNRPVYLLIEEKLAEHRFFVEDRFKPFPENPGAPFVSVFRNDRQRVYLIRY